MTNRLRRAMSIAAAIGAIVAAGPSRAANITQPVTSMMALPSLLELPGPGSSASAVSPTNAMPTGPAATTYDGTLSLAAATSTQLIASAGVTMDGGTSLPTAGNFATISIVNTGSALAYVCLFSTTCSAASGGLPLAAGASITRNVAGSTVAPSFYSPAGTTLWFSN
jgi:hypothetical protein